MKKHGMLLLLIILLFILLGFTLWYSNCGLKTVSYTAGGEKLPEGFEGYRILQLSDLHSASFGNGNARLLRQIRREAPDIIVMTGDMVGAQGDYSPLISLVKTLRQIKAGVPVYLIAGDEDPTPVVSNLHGNPEVLAEWVRAAQEVGAVYLDRPVSQSVGKQTAWFVPEYLYSVDITGMQESLTRQKQDMESAGQQFEGEGGAAYRALCYRLDAITASAAAIKV